jgi:thiosulfate dehydrogenase
MNYPFHRLLVALAAAMCATALHAATPGDAATFVPPAQDSWPAGPFGASVRLGHAIFVNTQQAAATYVGNGLTCANCHLDAGRLAHAAPLWAAYVSYPAYRSKDHAINTFAERVQGCFRYSMNGTAPALGSKELVALEAYSYWLATGAPTGVDMPGRGYPAVPAPPLAPDYARGATVYAGHCALCHGSDGGGTKVGSGYGFPPVWGKASFNWGAGMHEVDTAAGFIKANMPLGLGNTLSDQDAWDVAFFIDSHERPQDPRYTVSVAQTRKLYHDSPMSQYGNTVDGHLLGSGE